MGTMEGGKKFVYRIVATIMNPLGLSGTHERNSTTVFATRDLAESRIPVVRRKLQEIYRDDNLDVEIEVVEMEVIDT
jgi:hypothetical protein